MRQDILTDPQTLDLRIEGGDFVVGAADFQHMADTIEAMPGHYKQWPLHGAGVRLDLAGPLDGETRRRIALHLEADGYRAVRIEGGPTDGFLNIEL